MLDHEASAAPRRLLRTADHRARSAGGREGGSDSAAKASRQEQARRRQQEGRVVRAEPGRGRPREAQAVGGAAACMAKRVAGGVGLQLAHRLEEAERAHAAGDLLLQPAQQVHLVARPRHLVLERFLLLGELHLGARGGEALGDQRTEQRVGVDVARVLRLHFAPLVKVVAR